MGTGGASFTGGFMQRFRLLAARVASFARIIALAALALRASAHGSRPSYRNPSHSLFTLTVMFALIALSWSAQGVYTYQGVADTRPASRFSDFGLPVINDAGDVAFAARLKAGGSGIYKWSAATGALVTIFEHPTTDWFLYHNSFGSPATSVSAPLGRGNSCGWKATTSATNSAIGSSSWLAASAAPSSIHR